MFSFFKKKTQKPADDAGQAAKEDSVDQEVDQADPAALPAAAGVTESDVQAIEPEATQDMVIEPEARPVETVDPPPEAQPIPAVEEAPEIVPDPEEHAVAVSETPAMPAPAEKGSWLSRLKKGLSRTGQSLGGLFVGVKVDESLFEELETALIMADAGVEATGKLLTALRARVRKERLEDAGQVKAALRDILADHLAPLEKTFPLGKATPLVVMIAGVNGAGKTTSIGKLANHFQAQGAKVLLAAGDTFRAAAREQLVEWGARNNVAVIAQDGGDPAAVAFDAVNAGRAREAGVVMIDTAGRLPTQLHLMEELKKIKRVIGKADDAAPHEVLLVIDGNTGQNAIAQIRAFDAALNLTGLVVTKLDGTAKGGTLAAVAAGSQGVRPVPVYWIGVGESLHDLQPFVAKEFAAALLGD
ncbi:signal recognition particle-docking protein FtsY [Pollutimonas harenae]|uniref:Signal recognition particle receptor FtsY n=1 Tax=Pollutimonas harenae TaxID=657015 RepID=A0A853GLX1_9BURK|nr:signal recognition particle-docking protein FtsY [Pollutimonas harenae]NYT83988.1 signal recognition particle-docking protein FtsY [Pollutimonas harenae]TEA73585.1 signal recognition particle-docking protein FtsY [Pollutimonas harenae]